MPRIVDIAHFDKDSKKPLTIKIDEFEPTIDEKGWPQEGGFYIAIQDRNDTRTVIRISDREAVDLANRLLEVYRDHVRKFVELSRQSRKSAPQNKKGKTKVQENEDDYEYTSDDFLPSDTEG